MPSKNHSQPAIIITDLSKEFRIPHERTDTMRASVINLFRKTEYELFRALDNIDLVVRQGEFLGILGRNGSGKSTLLKIIGGIYRPTRGTVEIRGTMSPFLELGVGFNDELSARDNVYLCGTILGIPRRVLQRRFDKVISFAGVERFVDTKLKNFSSGMRVRLAFAVAIENDADIYLVDEVLAVGDQNFQRKCFEIFRTMKKQGKTVLFVSHSLSLLEQFCDRCIQIADGRIVGQGSPREVLGAYTLGKGSAAANKTIVNAASPVVNKKGPRRKLLTVLSDDHTMQLLARTGHRIDVISPGASSSRATHSPELPSNVRMLNSASALLEFNPNSYDAVVVQRPLEFSLVERLSLPKIFLIDEKNPYSNDPEKRQQLLEIQKLRERAERYTCVYETPALQEAWGLPGNVLPSSTDLSRYLHAWNEVIEQALQSERSGMERFSSQDINMNDWKSIFSLGAGWYGYEPGWRWTSSEAHALIQFGAGDTLHVNFACEHPFLTEEALTIELLSNEKKLGEYTLAHHSLNEELSVPIPRELRDHATTLAIRLSRTWNPSLHGSSEDTRDLGIAVRRIWVT